jgi:hypothetical protein
MITLFEQFTNKINIKDYIIEEGGIYKIPSVDYKYFSEWNLNREVEKPQFYKEVTYSYLMRLCLYLKFLRYNGNNIKLLDYIRCLINKDPKKQEIINKIPNNNTIFNAINKKFNLNYTNYKYNNWEDLQKFINNCDEILNDTDLEKYIQTAEKLSAGAEISEKIVKAVLNMLFSSYYEIISAEMSEDLKGIDIWRVSKKDGKKEIIQVKNIPGKLTMLNSGSTIFINNTNIDLHNYVKTQNSKLPYDFLGFYSEQEQTICLIRCNAIYSIDKKEKYIKIQLSNWAFKKYLEGDLMYKNILKIINVPKKFLPKNTKDVFYNSDDKKLNSIRVIKKSP